MLRIQMNIKIFKISHMLMVFDGIIDDIIRNKKLNQIITELFIRSKKLNISLVLLRTFILLYQIIFD